ncbi:predicted protein [Sparassis crispa]|uniref:Uncharacterized protein n=1 Tax=Sparassis crispa TaxID=139825 RepID=A0A401GHW2_9APHY|nr:predicted protein [Sparassis crispa]GBE81762.1 predicted protein [Sparassis crispa]
MYEEVCLLCGKPVNVDGRAYCSDECESLDTTSRSDSATSSAFTSPYLHSMNGTGILPDVPALVPSALGRSVNGRSALMHAKNRLSISSSSNSSVTWDTFTDDDEDPSNFGLHSSNGDDDFHHAEMLSADVGSSKSPGPMGQLSYVRRPSSTNNRSTIPLLHRRTSSISSPSNADDSAAQSAFAPTFSAEDDYSDVPSASISSSSSARSQGRRLRKSAGGDWEKDPETITAKSKRNRASLPAYFSLLTSAASPTSVRTQRLPSSIQTLTAISRSLQSSPPTPRVANPILDPTIAYAQHTRALAVEAAPRGRGRQRDPNARSPSCAHRSPGRSPACHVRHTRVEAQMRARLDSVEKVADWVSNSPVVGAQVRGRTLTRRNSSPPPKPRHEMLLADAMLDPDVGGQLDHLREALARSLHVRVEEERVEHGDDRRGRRRAEELDNIPQGVDRSAPGYGSGRSGLRARERGRPFPMR